MGDPKQIDIRNLLSAVGLIIAFVICSCHSKANKTDRKAIDTPGKTVLAKQLLKAKADTERYEDSALTVVEKLPEVKTLKARFDKQNLDTSHHFALLLGRKPDTSFKYYWVEVGDDTPVRFETYENFYVDPKSFIVYYDYYDVVSDSVSVLTIDQWRKSGKDYLYKKKRISKF